MKNRLHAERSNARRRFRLSLERLESRRLFAGLNVFVYIDQNGSRAFESGAESGAANRLVYLDVNQNARFDDSDPISVSDSQGIARFEGLETGNFQFGLLGSNPIQIQSSSVRPAAIATPLDSSAGNWVVGTEDLGHVWSIGTDGTIVSYGPKDSPVQLQLNGTVLSVTSALDGVAWALVSTNTNSTSSSRAASNSSASLVKLDLLGGAVQRTPVTGMDTDLPPTSIIRSGDSLKLIASDKSSARLTTLSIQERGAIASPSISIPVGSVIGGALNDQVFLLENTSAGSKVSQIKLLRDQAVIESSMVPTEAVDQIQISDDGSLLFASRRRGGVEVFNANRRLTSVALLSEAAGPIVSTSADGRVVTGNRSDVNQLIVWDRESWQPIGRTVLSGAVGANSSVRPLAILSDDLGDEAIVATSAGTFRVELAQPTLGHVSVGPSETGRFEFGVRMSRSDYSMPSEFESIFSLDEDAVLDWNLRSLADLQQASRADLFFDIANPPQNGSVKLSPSGEIDYSPNADFFGSDSVVVNVMDGVSISQLTLSLDVAPVNDPPRSISIDVPSFSPYALPGEVLGRVIVEDPDGIDSYELKSADPRFDIVRGWIVRSLVGSFDSSAQPSFSFEVKAFDALSGDRISSTASVTLADVNDPPTNLSISPQTVPENAHGAYVGTVSVDDPDGNGTYVFTVSDPRFEVVGDVLKLRDEEFLDFEAESNVALVIFVSDPTAGSGTESISTYVQFDVEDLAENNGKSFRLEASEMVATGPGSLVGTFQILDGDPNDVYLVTVSDDRFRVEGLSLFVADGVSLDPNTESNVALNALAVNGSGQIASKSVSVQVMPSQPPHQNPSNPLDVDGDGGVYSRDALIIINELNRRGPRPLPMTTRGEPTDTELPAYLDVNGDGFLSPIDVLIIINHLNHPPRPAPAGEGEGDTEAPVMLASALPNSDDWFAIDEDSTDEPLHCEEYGFESAPALQSENEKDDARWEIDAELSILLDQLASYRRG